MRVPKTDEAAECIRLRRLRHSQILPAGVEAAYATPVVIHTIRTTATKFQSPASARATAAVSRLSRKGPRMPCRPHWIRERWYRRIWQRTSRLFSVLF